MTLCIIDMQHTFEPSREGWLIERVCGEIEIAKQKREGIILLEFEFAGRTYENILKSLKDYDRQTVLNKYDSDGSRELLSGIKAHKFNKKRIRFCGVNTCACVFHTFWSTFEAVSLDTRLELISKAINCGCKRRGKRCIEGYVKKAHNLMAENVKVV